MALLRTPAEMAQLYQDAEVALISSPNSSYTILGRTFTQKDITAIHRIGELWEARANRATYGSRAAADVRTGEGR